MKTFSLMTFCLVLVLMAPGLFAQEEDQVVTSEVAPLVGGVLGEDAAGKFVFGIGLAPFKHKYEEPGLMEEAGWIVAPSVAGFGRVNLGIVNLTAEFEIARGSVDYDGASSDVDGNVEPLSLSNITDNFMELRLICGIDMPVGQTTTFTPAFGIGRRWLTDHMEEHWGGYLRESRYSYVPIIGRIQFGRGQGLHYDISLEYDLFQSGQQKSRLSDVSARSQDGTRWIIWEDVVNEQNSGSGFRASLGLTTGASKWGSLSLRHNFRLFVRRWSIDQSEIELITVSTRLGDPLVGEDFLMEVWEPENKTFQIGFSWMVLVF